MINHIQMASKLFTKEMGRGAYLLPFLEEELHGVSAVSKDAYKSVVERHSHLLFPPVQGTFVQSFNPNVSAYIADDKFTGDKYTLCVNDMKPYSKNNYNMTFRDMMDLLNIETRVQKWSIGYNTEERPLVDIVPDIIEKYYKNPIAVTIELTSKDRICVNWCFKKVLLPFPSFLSRRKSPKSLKRSSKSAQKRRKNKSKSKSKKRSPKPHRR